jgi:hypothetical protein
MIRIDAIIKPERVNLVLEGMSEARLYWIYL